MTASNPIKERSPWGVWLIAIVTLGVYFFVWYYKIHRELQARFPTHGINPAGALWTMLLGWIVIIPPYVSIANAGSRIARGERDVHGRGTTTTSGGIGLLLWIIAGLAMVYYQGRLNQLALADDLTKEDHHGAY